MTYEEFAKATPEEKKAFRKKMQENSISINDLKATLKVLEQYGKNFEWIPEYSKTLKAAYDIMTAEYERELDQEAHSKVTIEMEQGKDIPLAEWARNHNVSIANARQRAIRGTLPAHKVGNIWMINEFSENKDKRFKD